VIEVSVKNQLNKSQKYRPENEFRQFRISDAAMRYHHSNQEGHVRESCDDKRNGTSAENPC
jgi:hypothetical protein